jgi:NAD(P)-dependent dehydrogenase (short-subunit alcohol dehydrogenase family)
MSVAMIWGVSGEIGSAIADRARAEGWKILGISRGEQGFSEHDDIMLEADFSNQSEVDRAVLAASQEVDQVDLILYAAGDIVSTKVEEQPDDEWQRILESNLGGAVRAVHGSLPLLSGEGAIVVIGAKSERLRLPGLGAYAASKAGLEAWMEVLRKEQRKRQVLLVRPTAVKTSFWDKVPFETPANARPAEDIAGQIWQAMKDGNSGMMDLD